MAIENTYLLGKNITLGCGFDLQAKAPLDSRMTVETYAGLAALVNGNAAYEGMRVFVETGAEKGNYQYLNGEWKNELAELKTLIENTATAAMEFKGVATSLPANPSKGDMYKVTASFKVGEEDVKIGDSIVYDGAVWVIIPSGDDIEDTWRPVTDVNNDAALTFAAGDKLDVTVASNGTITYSHEEVAAPIATPVTADEQTRTYITSVETDGHGHITGYKTATETVEDTDTTYDFDGLPVGEGEEAPSNVYFQVKSSDAESAEVIYLDAYNRNETDAAIKVVSDIIDNNKETWDLAGTAVQTSDFNTFKDENTQAIVDAVAPKLDAETYNAYIAGKEMSDADLKKYAEDCADGKDEAIEAAQKAADDITAYVGTFTASEGIDTVVKYIDAKTANIASDERVNGIDNRVKAIEDNTYTKDAIDEIIGSYSVVDESGDLPETIVEPSGLRGEIEEAKGTAETAFIIANSVLHRIGVTDSILGQPTNSETGAEATGLCADVEDLDKRLGSLEAIDHDAYIDADATLKSELQAEIDADVKVVNDALEAYKTSNNEALAAETKDRKEADAGFETRIKALEDNFGDGEGTVEAQIAAAVKAEEDARKEAVKGVQDAVDALETEAAKHALKTELEAVDKRFADYTKTADLPTDLGEFTNNAGYAKTADVNTELDKKADKTQVATDIADAIAPLATTEALNGVKAIAEAARTEDEVNSQIDTKIAALNLGTTYEPIGAEDRAKQYVDGKFTEANLDKYTTEDEVKSIVDGVIKTATSKETLDSLVELVEYIDTHSGDAINMATAIGVLEGKVEVIEKKPAYDITATQISNWDNEVGAKALAGTKLDASTFTEYSNAHASDYTNKQIDDAIDADIASAIEAEVARANGAYDTKGDAAKAQEAAEKTASDALATARTEITTEIGTAISGEVSRADGKYEEKGVAQNIIDGLKLGETYEPIGAETRAIAAAKSETEKQVGDLAKTLYTKDEVDALIAQAHTWGEF